MQSFRNACPSRFEFRKMDNVYLLLKSFFIQLLYMAYYFRKGQEIPSEHILDDENEYIKYDVGLGTLYIPLQYEKYLIDEILYVQDKLEDEEKFPILEKLFPHNSTTQLNNYKFKENYNWGPNGQIISFYNFIKLPVRAGYGGKASRHHQQQRQSRRRRRRTRRRLRTTKTR